MTTLNLQVGTSADDGVTYGASTYASTTTSQTIGAWSGIGVPIDAWARFTGVSGLSGATIDVAYISLYEVVSQGSPLTKIYADDQASPSAPTTYSDHRGRTRTAAGVDWDSALGGAAWYDSPSIVSVIQELADSYDPDVIQVLHDDDGSSDASSNYIQVQSYDSDTSLATKLTIDYTAADGETRAVAGSQPTSTGILARIEQSLRAIAGSQPTATGVLVRVEQAIRALAGSQPSATGTLVAVKTTAARDVAGDQPTATGILTRIEKAVRAVVGSQPAAAGVLSTLVAFARALTGSQPSAAGTLTRSKAFSEALAGAQPSATGSLSVVTLGLEPVPDAYAHLADILVGARAVISERVAGASARDGVYVPGAIAHRGKEE